MVWWMVMLWWLIVCIMKGIQPEDVQVGKHLYVSITAFVDVGILHLVLPTGDDKDL
jgi:hypothetical protein